MKKIRKAVFPVGGLGTRFLPATKSTPKEMLPVANKPLIQYAFEEAINAGIEEFIFVTGRNKNAINNHFDHAYELQSKLGVKGKNTQLDEVMGWLPKAGQIAFVRQQEPLGLGHAVWCARNFIGDEPFVVILADEMILDKNNFLKSMIDLQESKESTSSIVAVAQVEDDQVNKYGIVAADHNSKQILDMVEKPEIGKAPSNLAINGRYILQPEIFEYLECAKEGSGGEIQLTDAMNAMSKDHPFYYQEFVGTRFDCGNVLGFLEANVAFALDNPKLKDDVQRILKKYA
ncbi:MAG: UTP--glucose-1-phosphate uridylyltransferase [Myxococcota bacterium]|jgi:UTP--glucose-1-phosphate uridylyltransferase